MQFNFELQDRDLNVADWKILAPRAYVLSSSGVAMRRCRREFEILRADGEMEFLRADGEVEFL